MLLKRSSYPVSDLEHAITGLPWFEQIYTLQTPVLGHLHALQIVFQKKKRQGNVIYLIQIFLKQYFV